jgi:hypothetical protein
MAAHSPAPTTTRIPTGEDILDSTGYCLLSLDGGGVRGLATLYILQQTMKELNVKRKVKGLGPKKPCDIFDLIGGTSTGGWASVSIERTWFNELTGYRLIAIMLGRLRMSVEECITAYSRLMKRIFEKKENRSIMDVLGRVKPRFSSEALAEAIKEVLDFSGHNIDEKFEETNEPTCKV